MDLSFFDITLLTQDDTVIGPDYCQNSGDTGWSRNNPPRAILPGFSLVYDKLQSDLVLEIKIFPKHKLDYDDKIMWIKNKAAFKDSSR